MERNATNKITKVTMNMNDKTLEDVNEIALLTGDSNRTSIVAKSIKLYKKLLEMQSKEKEKLYAREEDGTMTRIEIL